MTADPAAVVAMAVAAAGWPVLPIRLDTDEKEPAWRWADGSGLIWGAGACDPAWPRWATVCGVARNSDGRSLVCVDADTIAEVQRARRLLPAFTRVRTGKGEHHWLTLRSDADPRLRSRFLLNAGGLDWRGGGCIALLPGSQYRPATDPTARYAHLSGPAIHEAADADATLLAAVLGRHNTRAADRPTEPRHGGPGYAEFVARWREVVGAEAVREHRDGDASGPCPTDAHPEPISERGRSALHVSDDGVGGLLIWCHSRGCDFGEIMRAVEPDWSVDLV